MIEQNHEYYVSLEVAKLLKQAGFDWECQKYMLDEESFKVCEKCEVNFVTKNTNPNIQKYTYSAPTLAVAQKWLREVKGYILEITAVRRNPDDVYKTYIEYWYNIFEEGKCGHYDTYEEAQEAGIKKALEIILEKEE